MSERNYTVQTKINKPVDQVFAAIVDDGVVTYLGLEDAPPDVIRTSAAAVLAELSK